MRSEHPKGWTRVSLDDLTQDKSYGYTASASSDQEGPKFLRITDVVNRHSWDRVPFSDKLPSDPQKYKLMDGDVVIGRTGPVGVAWEIVDPPDAIFASYLVRFRFIQAKVAKGFMGYVLSSPIWRAYVEGVRTGSVQPQLNATLMGQFEFRIPPPREQRRIAWILGALDDKIELNRQMAHTLETMAAATFRARFVDFVGTEEFEDSELGSIPRGWEASNLDSICETKYGYTASATDKAVGPHLLRVTDINKNPWIFWESVPYCEISEKDLSKHKLQFGDIVVARMADPGKSAIMLSSRECVAASYLIRLRAASLDEALYIYGFLQSRSFDDFCRANIGGSVQKNMNARILASAEIVIPPSDQLRDFAQVVLPLRQKMEENLEESRRLTAIRDELLPKLISGKVRVPEGVGPDADTDEVLGELAAESAQDEIKPPESALAQTDR